MGGYVAIHTKEEARKRVVTARMRHPLKDEATYQFVLSHLRMGWSPEEVAGRLKRDKGSPVIHHETIYAYIYSTKAKGLKLWDYLPRKQKKRKKQTGRGCHKSRIPNRVSIHVRPEEIETREVFGHWEGDSVVGLGRKEGIHTEVERIGAVETVDAQIQLFEHLPKEAAQTVTVDNGKEFTHHQDLTKETGVLVFFADPYSSWQRETNENTNGRLRRYVPKKTSFSTLPEEELQAIVQELNNHPRKCLQYRKPVEAFNEELTAVGGFPKRM